MGLNSEKNMEVIKSVSEVAYKENSLKLQMDAVEKELSTISFASDALPEPK
jgi:hypothetical protein